MTSSLGNKAFGLKREDADLYGNKGFDWHNYNEARPTYPNNLFEVLFDYHKRQGAQYGLVCDFGTGTGTLLPQLLDRFEHVHASDLNVQQLDILRQNYSEEILAEKLSVEQEEAGKGVKLQELSVDLFVAATAVHHFDREAWYLQAARKLKVGGTLCWFNYQSKPYIFTHPAAEEPFTKLNDYFYDAVYKKGGKGGIFITSGIADSTMFKNFENPPITFFPMTERHYWHFPPNTSFIYPHKKWFEEAIGIYPNQGQYDCIDRATKVVEHSSNFEGSPTSMAENDWTIEHLIAYMVSIGVHRNFDLQDETFVKILQELESALGGPNTRFGVAWQVTMLLTTKR